MRPSRGRRGGSAPPARFPGGFVKHVSILGRFQGQSSVHFCGGCGAAFLADGLVDVFPIDVGGTPREFCACCHEFLGERLSSSKLARTPGYDVEGQELNARFPRLTPTEKRRHRRPDTQFQLADILRAHASRAGVRDPEPLFTSS